MQYLLVMVLSGTTMTILIQLVRLLLKKKLCARAYYLLAKTAVLYYRVPLPFLKSWYRDLIPTAVWERRMGMDRISLTWTNFTVNAHGVLHYNNFAVIQTVLVIAWFAGAGVKLVKKLSDYGKIVRWYSEYAEREMTEQERSFSESLRKKYGIRRRIAFLQARPSDPTYTFGVLRPIIICGKEVGSREAAFLADHEMVHIRRLDVLWKILMNAAELLHWWNPFMKSLKKDFDIFCECSCDEVVLRDRTEAEGRAYMRLMIEETQSVDPAANQEKKPTVGWETGFGNQRNEIRERVENLMMKNKWKRLATGALAAALIFGNSMTVFAYQDGVSVVMPEGASQEDVEFTLDNNFTEFLPDASDIVPEDEVSQEITLLYEKEFVDGEGNVYPIPEDDGVEPHCNHYYVSGEARDHHPYSDGSCEMRFYNAERCVRCGQMIYHELTGTRTWVTCPH